MHITWFGQGSFKLQCKDALIAIDPFIKETGLKPLRTKADILILSQKGKGSELAPDFIKENPFLIDNPGEYESKNVFIEGFDVTEKGSELSKAIYLIKTEGMKICHLGYVKQALSEEMIRVVDGVDILFLPIGGGQTFDFLEAVKTINAIEPRIVIPTHYKVKGLKEKKGTLEEFCQEYGVKKESGLDKIVLKTKDLPSEGTKIVILKPPQ